MQHTHRSLAALSFSGLAFLALFHAVSVRAVYPAFSGAWLAYSPPLAALWAAGIVAAWRGDSRLAPALSLGFFAAMGYGLFLLTGGASRLLVAGFFALGLAGQVALGRLLLVAPPRPADERQVVPGVRMRA